MSEIAEVSGEPREPSSWRACRADEPSYRYVWPRRAWSAMGWPCAWSTGRERLPVSARALFRSRWAGGSLVMPIFCRSVLDARRHSVPLPELDRAAGRLPVERRPSLRLRELPPRPARAQRPGRRASLGALLLHRPGRSRAARGFAGGTLGRGRPAVLLLTPGTGCGSPSDRRGQDGAAGQRSASVPRRR